MADSIYGPFMFLDQFGESLFLCVHLHSVYLLDRQPPEKLDEKCHFLRLIPPENQKGCRIMKKQLVTQPHDPSYPRPSRPLRLHNLQPGTHPRSAGSYHRRSEPSRPHMHGDTPLARLTTDLRPELSTLHPVAVLTAERHPIVSIHVYTSLSPTTSSERQGGAFTYGHKKRSDLSI